MGGLYHSSHPDPPLPQKNPTLSAFCCDALVKGKGGRGGGVGVKKKRGIIWTTQKGFQLIYHQTNRKEREKKNISRHRGEPKNCTDSL